MIYHKDLQEPKPLKTPKIEYKISEASLPRLVFAVLLFGKLFQRTDISWGWILAPLWISWILNIIQAIFFAVFNVLRQDKYNRYLEFLREKNNLRKNSAPPPKPPDPHWGRDAKPSSDSWNKES